MENKVIVITGGSRGLGKAIAENFAVRKAKVVISGRDREALEQVSKETGAISVVADITRENEVSELAEKAVSPNSERSISGSTMPGVWLPSGPLEEVDMKRAHDIFEVNVFGTMYGSRIALSRMKKQGYGTIVNIVSTAALQGRPNQTIYSASKFAERGFTDSLREEIKGTGITVIGIYPGGIKTNLFDEQKPKEFDDFMSPESIAEKIAANLGKAQPETEVILRRQGQA